MWLVLNDEIMVHSTYQYTNINLSQTSTIPPQILVIIIGVEPILIGSIFDVYSWLFWGKILS